MEEIRPGAERIGSVEGRTLRRQQRLPGSGRSVNGVSLAALGFQSSHLLAPSSIVSSPKIEELIQLAKDMRSANARGEALKLSGNELAFYDALEVNDSAVKVLGEPTLVNIAASEIQFFPSERQPQPI